MRQSNNSGMIKGAIIILAVSQLLNLFLALASFDNVYRSALTSRFQVITDELKKEIETAVDLGKPIDRFTGMKELLQRGLLRDRDISSFFVTTVNGKVLGSSREEAVGKLLHAGEIPKFSKTDERQYSVISYMNHYYISVPVYHNETDVVGLIFCQFKKGVVTEKIIEVVKVNLQYFLWILLAAGCMVAALLLLIDRTKKENGNRWKFFSIERRKTLAIILVLLFAQSYYTYLNISYFKEAYSSVTRSKILSVSASMKNNVQFLIGLGLPVDRLKDMDILLEKSFKDLIEYKEVYITDSGGRVLYEADKTGSQSILKGNLLKEERKLNGISPGKQPGEYVNDVEYVSEIFDSAGNLKGYLVFVPDLTMQKQTLDQMLQDSITIILVSLLFGFEMLMFLTLIVKRKRKDEQSMEYVNKDVALSEEQNDNGLKIIRIAAFTFFLGDLFSMSFMPLFIEKLYNENPVNLFGLSKQTIISLPISAYIIGVTIFVPVVGFLSKKVSVKNMFYLCIAMSMTGSLLTALSVNVYMIIIFRFVAGLGYGGTIVNAVDFVIQNTDNRNRTTGFGHWSAGYAAASICALPVSSVIVSKFGYRVGMMLSVVTAAFFAMIVYYYVRDIKRPVDQNGSEQDSAMRLKDIFAVFRSRNIAMCLLLSSIPLQICFVGIYQFFFPLYMDSIEISQANIGRLLSIFGLISLLTPVVGSISDKLKNNRVFLIVGNAIVGAAFMLYLSGGGIVIVAISIAALGIGSTLVDAVREAYLTSMEEVKQIGEAKLISIFATYEKFATILAPVMIGALMTSIKPNIVIVYMGIVILVTITLFAVFTRPAKAKDLTIQTKGVSGV